MFAMHFNFPEPAHPDSGVYCITNIYTQDMYIGSSIHLDKRMNEHRRVLRKGQHHSRYLQRVWDKYGEQAFKFSVLGYYDKAGALETEQWWLDNATCAYNGSRVATRPDHSDEVRAHIGRAVAEKWKNPDFRAAATERTRKMLHDRPELVERFTTMVKSRENTEKIKASHRARNRKSRAKVKVSV